MEQSLAKSFEQNAHKDERDEKAFAFRNVVEKGLFYFRPAATLGC